MGIASYNFNNINSIFNKPVEPAAYFFIGDDYGQIDMFNKKVINGYFGSDDRNVSLFYFDEFTKNPEEVLINTVSLDLFHSKKAVVIKNLKETIGVNELNILQKIAESNLLLLHGDNLKKSINKLFEVL